MMLGPHLAPLAPAYMASMMPAHRGLPTTPMTSYTSPPSAERRAPGASMALLSPPQAAFGQLEASRKSFLRHLSPASVVLAPPGSPSIDLCGRSPGGHPAGLYPAALPPPPGLSPMSATLWEESERQRRKTEAAQLEYDAYRLAQAAAREAVPGLLPSGASAAEQVDGVIYRSTGSFAERSVHRELELELQKDRVAHMLD
jgi:hypothetical protein